MKITFISVVLFFSILGQADYSYERDKLREYEQSLSQEMTKACGRSIKLSFREFLEFSDMLLFEKNHSVTWECRLMAEEIAKACMENPQANPSQLKGINSILCRRASLGKRKFEVVDNEIRWYGDALTSYKADAKDEIKANLKIRFAFVGAGGAGDAKK